MNIIEQLEAKKATVRQRAEAFCRAIDEVIELFKGDEDHPVAGPATQSNGPARKSRAVPAHSGALAIAREVAKVREPFGTAEVRTAAGIEFKQASNWILRAAKSGWLKRLEFGSYQRTENYPQDTEELHRQIRAEVDADLAKKRGED